LLARWLSEAGATRADIDDLMLAAAEAAANAIEHAYGLERGVFELRARQTDDGVALSIIDHGNWRASRGTNRGRGFLLMEGLTDDVEVIQGDEGTTVELCRRLGTQAA
jgi:serine/threonine-protein kinase RsbW